MPPVVETAWLVICSVLAGHPAKLPIYTKKGASTRNAPFLYLPPEQITYSATGLPSASRMLIG